MTGPNQPQTLEHAEFTTRTPGNLRFAYAHDVTIRGSAFRHLGAVALDFSTGSQHDTVANSSSPTSPPRRSNSGASTRSTIIPATRDRSRATIASRATR